MPKKYLSQNFLYDPTILRKIIEVAHLEPGDMVVEIGPGPGRLTRMLAEKASKVIAIEVDVNLYERLKEYLADLGNVEIVKGDALKYPYSKFTDPFKVVANIPYHITTPLIFKLLECKDKLVSMTITIQKEVAERIAAKPGGKSYGVLSLTVQYFGRARMCFTIPRGAFRPVPKVDSACLHIDILDKPVVDVKDEEQFFRIIKTSFSQRRKTLQNALKKMIPDIRIHLESVGINPLIRAEKLGIEDFAALANELNGHDLSDVNAEL